MQRTGPMTTGMLDAREFGAKGDGQADDTGAIQRALDAAGEAKGAVIVPPGTYCCSTLHLHSHTELRGLATYSYRDPGGSILRLADEAAKCLLDITGAIGCGVNGLCLEGEGHGTGIHGILLDKPD
ncbi:MAG: hypothetical protein HQ592_16310, partial [Planctomycetes bacterium]|nr:hypothetical protein [Planctomycetota bacterium]